MLGVFSMQLIIVDGMFSPYPPSITMFDPLMYDEAGDAKKITDEGIS